MADQMQTPTGAAPDQAQAGVDGERGISSISGTRKSGLNEKNKKILVAAGLVFLGTLAVLQWPSGDELAPAEEEDRRETKIRPGRNFEPAEISQPEVVAPVVEAAPEAEPQAPVGPIERVRREEALGPDADAIAKELYESSVRAPLMAVSNDLRRPSREPEPEDGGAAANLFGAAGEGGGKLSGLAAELVTSDRSVEFAKLLPAPDLTITQGTSIPCALDTAMDSTAPGMVRCTVTDDVYSTTGAVILLDRGSRIVGEYKGGMQRGRKRLFVVWTRAETPTGVVVNLGSPGTDALGRTGFDGDIDTQFWTRFGGTMMLSIIDDALILAADSGHSSDDDRYENTRAATRSLAQTELESTIDVPVILRKNQGEEVSVMVARDLDFSGVYRLR